MGSWTKKFYMTNVVWYDGNEANVSKFIIECCEEDDGYVWAFEKSERKVYQYFASDIKVLEIDLLYPMTSEEITALSSLENSSSKDDQQKYSAYERFICGWY